MSGGATEPAIPDGSVPLREVEIRGKLIPVHVTPTGEFVALAADSLQRADTLKALRSKLETVRNIRVAVGFSQVRLNPRISDTPVRHGTITGIDEGSRDFLVRWDNGSTGRTSCIGEFLQRLSPDESDRLVALIEAVHQARDDVSAFVAAHRLYATAAVEAAINAAKESAEGWCPRTLAMLEVEIAFRGGAG